MREGHGPLFRIATLIGRPLAALERARRRLPGRWPQIVAFVAFALLMVAIDAWRDWLRHQFYSIR